MNPLNFFPNLSHHAQFTQKGDKPERRESASRFWLYLPAYLALFVSLGASCHALSHFITNPNVTAYLWMTLIINFAVSIGVQCGNSTIKRWGSRARVFLFIVLPVSALIFNASVISPLEAEAEINATVSMIVGWSALFCVLLVRMRYGSNQNGEQHIPLAAPLVPALSLFGLLNSLSVDTIVQICFVIFVAASLYLIAYERMLNRALKDGQNVPVPRPSNRRIGSLSAEQTSPTGLSRLAIGRAAVGYFVACSIWFAVFMGGAALFYYPIEATVPRVMGMPLNAVRSASAAMLDWRGSSSTMELRGGNYPLSDREIMQIKVAPEQGVVPELWRGHIYENYSDSRWNEDSKSRAAVLRVKRRIMTPVKTALEATGAVQPSSFQESLPPKSPRLVREVPFEARVEPQRSSNMTLYFPGELSAIQGVTQFQAFSNGTYNAVSSYRAPAYTLRANIKRERLSALKSTPGLSASDLKRWRNDSDSAPSLRIDEDLKKQLAPIIAQIKNDVQNRPGARFDTPAAKADAISDYLKRTCVYSLSSPLVPPNQDAIIFFLTRSKSGACDMFASAMAMLLRAADVPARLATGYVEPEESTGDERPASGPQTPFGQQAPYLDAFDDTSPENAVSYVVRERNAHAWVEYYIPGAGWLNYDPTQGTRTTALPLEAQIAGILNFPNLNLSFKTLWLPGLGLLLIATGLGWSFFDYRSRKNGPPPTPEEVERAHVTEVYGQAVALLSRRVPRARHQTPLEYEAEVQRASIAVPAKQEFSALTYVLMSARYRRQPPTMNRQELQACLTRLRRAL